MVAEIANGGPYSIAALYPFGRLRPGNRFGVGTKTYPANPLGWAVKEPFCIQQPENAESEDRGEKR
jgi:hypothetical protein